MKYDTDIQEPSAHKVNNNIGILGASGIRARKLALQVCDHMLRTSHGRADTRR